jgi:hypothetical protein
LLEQRSQEETATHNVSKVNSALVEKYGDKAAEVLSTRAQELGTTVQALKGVSQQNPDMVLALFADVAPSSDKNPVTPTSATPRPTEPSNEYPTFEKPPLRGGATNKEILEALRKSKEYTNKRLGVES